LKTIRSRILERWQRREMGRKRGMRSSLFLEKKKHKTVSMEMRTRKRLIGKVENVEKGYRKVVY